MNADKDLEFGGCRSYRTARYLAWISTHTRVRHWRHTILPCFVVGGPVEEVEERHGQRQRGEVAAAGGGEGERRDEADGGHEQELDQVVDVVEHGDRHHHQQAQAHHHLAREG